MRISIKTSSAMNSSYSFTSNHGSKDIRSVLYSLDDYSTRSFLNSGSSDAKHSINGGRLQRMLMDLNEIERTIESTSKVNLETSSNVKSGCRNLENLIVSLVEQYGYTEVPSKIIERLSSVIDKFNELLNHIINKSHGSLYEDLDRIDRSIDNETENQRFEDNSSNIRSNGPVSKKLANGAFSLVPSHSNSSSEFEDEINR